SSEKVKQIGGTVLEGNLEDVESLRKGARTCDAIIHLAFVHDFSSPEAYQNATLVDRTAISAMGEEIAGTGKALIIASGTLGFPQGQL
ncbi:UNVERIFIED_CONTAM: 3-beta hydroxysteroid dehydrogenase, partial [Bacteroidetes bacterium 56_B9]